LISRARQLFRGALFAAALASAGAFGQGTAVDAGRGIYREGLLPTGEPLTAIVANDVPILGTQFSCQSCHGRSGMGAAEGPYIVPPIAAQFLYVESPQPKRPAYTAESLARVLREGVTPAERELDRLMPRYKLSDAEVGSLAAYLATLSPGNSPGVDDTVIRFATVVTEGVDPADRDAVLAVLNQFFVDINRETRAEGERWDRGYTPESRLPTVFREWVLEEWSLAGPPESWAGQLEEYYRRAPVFAMVSGLGNDTWGPVGRFCERREIPCLFPGTDLPEAQAGDFYTLYFSRGIDLEADLIAEHLAAQPVAHVTQLLCEQPTSMRGASVLRARLRDAGTPSQELRIDCRGPLPATELAELLGANRDAAAVLWLNPTALDGLDPALPAGRIYVSSTLLDARPPAILASVAAPLFMAHPFRLPGKPDSAMRRFAVWAKLRGVEVTRPRLQAEAFFALTALNDAVKHLGRFFVRDYVLDMLDHAQSLAAYLPVHPRPTLGPGQRFLTKGGYMLPLVDGEPDTRDAAWVLP
jgi:cytochrome c553